MPSSVHPPLGRQERVLAVCALGRCVVGSAGWRRCASAPVVCGGVCARVCGAFRAARARVTRRGCIFYPCAGCPPEPWRERRRGRPCVERYRIPISAHSQAVRVLPRRSAGADAAGGWRAPGQWGTARCRGVFSMAVGLQGVHSSLTLQAQPAPFARWSMGWTDGWMVGARVGVQRGDPGGGCGPRAGGRHHPHGDRTAHEHPAPVRCLPPACCSPAAAPGPLRCRMRRLCVVSCGLLRDGRRQAAAQHRTR
jgi:hypothetical protein